jgi:Zn-dependent protease with chaperone function
MPLEPEALAPPAKMLEERSATPGKKPGGGAHDMHLGQRSPDAARRYRTTIGAKGLLALLLMLALGCGSPASPQADRPGDIVIRDEVGEGDEVEFHFLTTVGPSQAEAAALRAMREAGLPVRRSELHEHGSVLEVEVDTTVGRRTGFLQREVPGAVFYKLSPAAQGLLILQLRPDTTVVRGSLYEAGSGGSGKEFIVARPVTVAYRVSAAKPMSLLGAVLLLGVGPYPLLRRYVRRLRRRPMDGVEKVHRLRWILVVFVLLPAVYVPAFVLTGFFDLPELVVSEVVPGWTRIPAVMVVVGLLLIVLVFLAPVVSAAAAVMPFYRKLRGIQPDRRDAARRVLLASALLLPLLAWTVARITLSGLFRSSPALYALAIIVLFVLLLLFGPLTLLVGLDTYRLPTPMRERLLGMCRQHGLKVRDIRAFRSRRQKMATAAILGLVGPLRYVVISDYLLDTFGDDEIEAVLAHEIAHGKKHHLLIKTGGLIGSWLAGVVLVGALFALFPRVDPVVAVFVAPLLLPAAVLLVQGVLGLRLERLADQYASDTVGLEPTLGALERLAEVNMVKRRTGRLWNLLQQHPGIEQRVERLRARAAEVT